MSVTVAAPLARHNPATASPRCSGCQTATFTGWRSGDGTLFLRCADCDRFIHQTPARLYAHEALDPERHHSANQWPQSGDWTWAGFVQDRTNRQWLLVATADSLDEVWDALDASWLHGARLAMPVRDGSDVEFEAAHRPAATKPETCGRCGSTDVGLHWRTLSNGHRRVWGRCAACRRGTRSMPMTPGNIALANANEEW